MNSLAIILSIIGGFILIATTLVSIWVIPLYRQLNTIHSKIRAKNDEIDAVEQECQFVVDKLPFFK